MRTLVLSLYFASALQTAACHSSGMTSDANEALACTNSGRADTYVAGLEHKGESDLYNFKLVSAMPAPPMRNLNTWVIQINWEATGAPVTSASLVVTLFMPDHQRGADGAPPQIQELSTPGQYRISNINTSMAGYWEITLTAMTPDKVTDTVVYKFCIPA